MKESSEPLESLTTTVTDEKAPANEAAQGGSTTTSAAAKAANQVQTLEEGESGNGLLMPILLGGAVFALGGLLLTAGRRRSPTSVR
ncbi:MAG: hypothetical protein ABR540_23265 [Acidimicrobiales bacterium]